MKAIFKQSNTLSQIKNIQHGFFTNMGGVSSGIYASLNCGPSSHDDSENVIENRQRVMTALGLKNANLYGLHQIHSTIVCSVSSTSSVDDYPKADALITTEKGVALSVLGADCTPVLLSSKDGKVIAAAHAGWKGSVTGIIKAVVNEMCKLGVKREEITACIGPTIHQESYEVQNDFIQELTRLSKIPARQFIEEKRGRYYFDLPAYLLEQCKKSHIAAENLGLDTYALKDEFFSYRRNTHEGIKDYGRQISVICLV